MCFLHYSFCLVLQRGRLPCEPGSAALHTWCFFGSVDKLCWLFVPELFHLFSISLLYPRAHSTRETRDGVSWCRVRTERPAGQVYLTGAPGGQLWTPYWWWLDSPVCHCTHRHKVGCLVRRRAETSLARQGDGPGRRVAGAAPGSRGS